MFALWAPLARLGIRTVSVRASIQFEAAQQLDVVVVEVC